MNKILLFICACSLLAACTGQDSNWHKEFTQPSNEYLPQPFWHLNGEMRADKIHAQLEDAYLKDGFGGVTVLPLTEASIWSDNRGDNSDISPATSPEFLSQEYFERYRLILEYSKELDRQVVLYDDIDFPSGTAGGRMEKEYPQYTRKELRQSLMELKGPAKLMEYDIEWTDDYLGTVAMNMETLQRIDLTDKVSDRVLNWLVPEGDWKIMTFYIKSQVDGTVDFMDPEAVKTFISLTYDEYAQELAPYFGSTITRIYFDDIGYFGHATLWNRQISSLFEERTGKNAMLYLPALWNNIGEETKAARVTLFGIRAELMANYPKLITEWCTQHGLEATGHPSGNYEPNTNDMYGDPFEFYKYQHIPLLDIIHGYPYGRPGLKLISSAADLYDRQLVGAEIYGNYSNEETDSLMLYRAAMEAMVRGVNYFIPHGMWLTPEKMKIPPLIMHDNEGLAPAFPEYNAFMGRSCFLLRGGNRVADIGLLFPIESLQAWSDFSMSAYSIADLRSGNIPEGMSIQSIFASMTGKYVPKSNDYNSISDLLSNQVRRDFTFIHPQRFITEKYSIHEGTITMNAENTEQRYRLFILPASQVISVATLEKLRDYYQSGGKIIATHELPMNSAEFGKDAEVRNLISEMFGTEQNLPSDRFTKENEAGGKIIFLPRATSEALQEAIDELLPDPDVKIESVEALVRPETDVLLGVDKYRDLPPEELGAFSYIHKKKEGRNIFLFANSTNMPVSTLVQLKGKLKLEKWDPHTGDITNWKGTHSVDENGSAFTTISVKLPPVSSIYAVSD